MGKCLSITLKDSERVETHVNENTPKQQQQQQTQAPETVTQKDNPQPQRISKRLVLG